MLHPCPRRARHAACCRAAVAHRTPFPNALSQWSAALSAGLPAPRVPRGQTTGDLKYTATSGAGAEVTQVARRRQPSESIVTPSASIAAPSGRPVKGECGHGCVSASTHFMNILSSWWQEDPMVRMTVAVRLTLFAWPRRRAGRCGVRWGLAEGARVVISSHCSPGTN